MNGTSHRKHRIFFALPVTLDKSGAMTALLEDLAAFSSSLKLVPPDNYHITMKFLGSVDDGTCTGIMNAFNELSLPKGAIPYRLMGAGAFPGVNRPSVLWIGFDLDRNRIADLFTRIEELTAGFGFEPEKREFTPHLTIARVKDRARPPGELTGILNRHNETVFAESRFDRIVLNESKLCPNGPIYTAIASQELE